MITYRIFFKFKVRNGDISAFLRDVDTNQFITNANVAPHGFYIDVANSQYLTMTIKREVLSESLDGLVEDTKFSGVAREGRNYTDEGIYTVTIKNLATGDSVTKRVYVGDRSILLVHMKTGMPISEINERLAAGAYIDDNGQLVDPVQPTEEPVADVQMPEEPLPSPEVTESEVEPQQPVVAVSDAEESPEEKSEDASAAKQNDHVDTKPNMIVIGSVAAVVLVSAAVALSRRAKKERVGAKEDSLK